MQTLQIDISNPTNQKHTRHFVERHIGENQTMFVSELFDNSLRVFIFPESLDLRELEVVDRLSKKT